MIHAYVLNGYASSLRKTRTANLVESTLEESGAEYALEAHRAMLISSRSRKVRRRIQRRADPEVALLLVGKSLGARNMVERVINRMGPVRYRGIYLVTIDPCWPACWDWTPNRNRAVLRLDRYVDDAINVQYVTSDDREQAGALLAAPRNVPLRNEFVTDADHFSVVDHPVTRHAIKTMVAKARSRS